MEPDSAADVPEVSSASIAVSDLPCEVEAGVDKVVTALLYIGRDVLPSPARYSYRLSSSHTHNDVSFTKEKTTTKFQYNKL